MSLCLTTRIASIVQRLTGRSESLFARDLAARDEDLLAAVRGKRVLVVGGAGSIGAACLFELLARQPAAVVVMDVSENNLVELIRSIRSSDQPYEGEIRFQPLDYGSPLAAAYLAEQATFDLVLSFAALKHVRSERDIYSVLRMLSVNLVDADRFLGTLRRNGHGGHGVFFVSTDKAADPINLMGASKRAMELLLWQHTLPTTPSSLLDGGNAPPLSRVTTARFANVAFSDGSLPWSFLERIEKGQALACPQGIRRYLVSPREAGELCLLASLVIPHRHVFVPLMDPDRDAFGFDQVAAATLAELGLKPKWYRDESEARDAVERDRAAGSYPVLLTGADTSGEKPMETFVADGETAADVGLSTARAVTSTIEDGGPVVKLLTLLDQACRTRDAELPNLDRVVGALQAVVPALRHQVTGKSLDDRM